MRMFRQWRDRADRAMRSAAARNAGESTYEAIRRDVMKRAPRDAMASEAAILDALARRRSWRRLGERDFECAFGRRSVRVNVPAPLDVVAFFRRITRVEVEVFLGDSDPDILRDLHILAQRELERLLTRDGAL